MKMNVCIISAQNVEYEKNGRKVKGVSIEYVDNLDPYDDGDMRGYKVSRGWLKPGEWDHLTTVPAFYDVEMKISTDYKGNKSLVPVTVEFATEV